ncbi:hypothetical protein ACLB2K_020740 [Fragaria x ananassa]
MFRARHLIRSTSAITLGNSNPILSSPLSSNLPAHNFPRVRSYFRDRDKNYVNRCPINFGVLFVPEAEAFVVQRCGKFTKVLPPGVNFLVPFLDKVAYVHNLKEEVINVPNQSATTKDNVEITIDAVLYLKIVDPYKASYGGGAYGGGSPLVLAINHAQAAMRSAIGLMTLDRTFEGRNYLNEKILEALKTSESAWGLSCLRYEIRDITPPRAVRESMGMQADAERRKRALILTSEGERQKTLNKADGDKTRDILEAEAKKRSVCLLGEGQAQAIKAKAEADAQAIKVKAEAEAQAIKAKAEAEAYTIKAKAAATSEGIALMAKKLEEVGGQEAAALTIAEQYVNAFGNLAKEGTTVLLPSSASDPASMISQALSIYKRLSDKPSKIKNTSPQS